MKFDRLPIAARAYITASVLMSAYLLGIAVFHAPLHIDVSTGAILVAAVLASLSKVELPVKNGRMNLSNAVIFLSIIVYRDPVVCVLAATISGFVGTVIQRQKRPDGSFAARITWYKPGLSIANLIQSAWISSSVWNAAYGGHRDHEVTAWYLISLLLMSVAYFLVNTLGIALAVALSQRLLLSSVWGDNFLWTFPGYLCAACAAAGAAIMEARLGLGSFLLLPPVWVVYYSYKLYLDKVNGELAHVQDLNELNSRVISTLAMTIEAKDRYTHKHVERVREYAMGIARELGVVGPELEAVRIGSMVHDIGKIAVPEAILTKPGKLTSDEFQRMKIHVGVGVKILEAVRFPFPATDAVAAHHERWDGNGYPLGLKGEAIPRVGRIVALADGFDALTCDRHYRKAMSYPQALELIESQRAQQYDPACIDALVRSLPKVTPIIDDLNRQEYHADEFSDHRRVIPQEALEEISRAAEEAVLLAEMALKSGISHSAEEVMDRLLEMARHLVPCTTAAVFLIDFPASEIRVARSAGLYRTLVDDLRMKLGEGISGWVAANNSAALNAPATGDLARRVHPGDNLELNSAMSVPIASESGCFGAITLYHTGYNLYTEHHQRVLTTLASHAAIALETIEQLRLNQALAHTDALTGLPNMRALIQWLEELTDAPGGGFSLLVLDLNGFKLINDTLGHLAGDQVLQDVAEMLQRAVRTEDMPGRYAGDEFVIICPETPIEVAHLIADRIKRDFSLHEIAGNADLSVSASIGISCFPADGDDWRSLLSAADRRMYADKLIHQQDPEKGDACESHLALASAH